MKPIIYEFSAYTCAEGRSPEPFSMAISAPEAIDDMLAACHLICPFVRPRPLILHGVDGNQALELSRRFVERWLSEIGVRLVDAEGRTVSLPPVPRVEA